MLSCSPDIAGSLCNAFPNQVDVIDCQNFSWEQLHELLDRRLGSGWPAIPEEVREVLKVPLLAGIYCDEFGDRGWLPTSEYELYERVWKRLSCGTASPLNATRVESLARGVLEGGTYPWTGHQLVQHGVDDASLERLISAGWVVRTGDDRFRLFHILLLQWAVAKAICAEFSDGRIALADVAKSITEIVEGTSATKDVFLGFVPMDVLWILSQAGHKPDGVGMVLAALEATNDRYSEALYKELVPTLGEQVAEAVFLRYRDFKGRPWIRARPQRISPWRWIPRQGRISFSGSERTGPGSCVQCRLTAAAPTL